MTTYFIRLPAHDTIPAALDYAPSVAPARLERGPDGSIRGSVEVRGPGRDAMTSERGAR